MRLLATLALCPVLLLGCSEGASTEEAPAAPTSQAAVETPASQAPPVQLPAIELVALKEERVEVGCAKCSYDMAGAESCMAAAMVAGRPVLIGGAGEEHAHAFCGGTKYAVITAEVVDGQLVASNMVVE